MKGTHWWVLRDRAGNEVGRHKTFDQAVQELARQPGEWAANWSQTELLKGHHAVTPLWEPDRTEEP